MAIVFAKVKSYSATVGVALKGTKTGGVSCCS